MGVLGYVMLVMLLSGLVYAFPKAAEFVIEFSTSLVFYGMYYGVLGRDFAELCVDYMAASMKVCPVQIPVSFCRKYKYCVL